MRVRRRERADSVGGRRVAASWERISTVAEMKTEMWL